MIQLEEAGHYMFSPFHSLHLVAWRSWFRDHGFLNVFYLYTFQTLRPPNRSSGGAFKLLFPGLYKTGW